MAKAQRSLSRVLRAALTAFVILGSLPIPSALASSRADPLNPAVPRSVPLDDSAARQALTIQEKRLIPKGTKSVKEQGDALEEKGVEDDATRPEDEGEKKGGIRLESIKIPRLDYQKSQANKRGRRRVSGPISGLPVFSVVPPKGIAAYLGQTLELMVQVKPGRDEPVNIIWIANSRILCTGAICRLPLDGENVDAGATGLTIVAYHTGGSVQSKHILQVVRGRWKKGKPFNRRFLKRIASRPAAVQPVSFDPQGSVIFAQSGAGVLAYPETFRLIGDIGLNTDWSGRLRSDANGVMKMAAPNIGEWYILKRSSIRFIKQESPLHREVFVERGGIRMRTLRRSAHGEPPLPLEDMGVETSEVRVVASEGADVFVVKSIPPRALRQKGKARSGTRVIVISGTAQVQLKKSRDGEPKLLNLPPGLELFVFDDGEIIPLRKPETHRMDRLLDITITPAEVSAEIAARNAERAQAMDLGQVIKEAETFMESEDFFEVIATISPVASRLSEDVRLPYLMASAQRGLDQLDQAEKYYTEAFQLDPTFFKAPWEMALMKMEQRDWTQAEVWLEKASDVLPDGDSRQAEYHYYAGVIQFQKKEDFSSRSSFTRALWEPALESALRGSAGSFMKTLQDRKGWSLVAPIGVQYDQNVLSLTEDEAVPEPFPGRAVLRSIAGLIYATNPAGLAESTGVYHGFGGKLMSIINFPRDFSGLDVILGDVSLSQSFVRLEKPQPAAEQGAQPAPGDEKKTVTKLTETLGFVLLNDKLSTLSFDLGVTWQEYDFHAIYEASFSSEPFGEDDAVIMTQASSFSLFSSDNYNLTLPVSLKQNIPIKTDETKGMAFTLSLLPTYSYVFSPRMTAAATLKAEPEFEARTGDSALTLTGGVGFNLTYFVTPWFLLLPSATFDVISSDDKDSLVMKPVASLLTTALF